ncbi:MAG: citrate lyase beta subunit [Thermodesulfobacteriota bacterium]|nr:citrate lyase beta subunit [Thermodesulfobacteriota bacterium]
MNVLEKEIIVVLKELKEKYGVFEIKAEFEAEGSRMEEILRLKDVTSTVPLPIILKIGGVEAITDMYNCLGIGVKGIVAPMAETAYALSKFLNAIKNFVPEDNAADIDFAFNLETITAYENFDKMLELPDLNLITGMTIGRVDLTGSMNKGRSYIDSDEVFEICETAFKKAKENNIKTGLGGGISTNSIEFIKRLKEMAVLDKFETRKVVFQADSIKYGEEAILKAVEFELLWLKSKRRYYHRIKAEDESRIPMLEKRLNR